MEWYSWEDGWNIGFDARGFIPVNTNDVLFWNADGADHV